MSRSSLRLVAGLIAVAGMCVSRPSSADVDNFAPGVTGEGARILGEPDALTGALTQTFPIELPRARGISQPKLALRYSSASRDREAGYGWGLELPVIERRPLSGYPEFDASGSPLGDERYTSSGKLLVRICQLPSCSSEPNTSGHPQWATTGGWWYYRLQVDGSSTRFYRSADRLTWRVLLPGGERLEFGKLLEDGAGIENFPAYERDVTNTGVVRWRLAAQKDPQHPKNFVIYRWDRASFVGNSQLILTDVYYTPPAVDAPSTANFAHHVQLDWDPLPTPISRYPSAERVGLSARLKRIAVASAPWDTAGTPAREVVRAYNLTYLADRTDATYDPASIAPLFRHSFLRQVQMQGRCRPGATEESGQIPAALSCPSLPPVRFEYSPGIIQTSTAQQSVVFGQAGAPFEQPNDTMIVDFDRDGRPDIVGGWPSGTHLNCTPPEMEYPQNRFQTTIKLTPSGEPELWCRSASVVANDPSTPSDDEVREIREFKLRSARPMRGYLNDGLSGNAYHLLHQCMDTGSGATGTLTEIASHDQKARLFNAQGSTVRTGAGNAVVFWQDFEHYYPVVARPLTLPSGASPGGCNLDNTFSTSTFFPTWAWEPEIPFAVPAGEFARTYVNIVKGSSYWDIHPEGTAEPAFFVDVDGDGFADKLAEDTVAAADLFRPRIYFSRYYSRTNPPPLGAGGAGVGPALVPFVDERTPSRGLMPARRVRTLANGTGPTHFWYSDINGDGIVDLVMASPLDGTVPRVRPGDGRGTFSCDSTAQPGGCLPGFDASDAYFDIDVISTTKPWDLFAGTLIDPLSFQFHDVTGDGLADIVAVKDGSVYAWANIDGKRFACVSSVNAVDPCVVGALPSACPYGTVCKVTFADMNADGVDDVVVVKSEGIQVVSLFAPSNSIDAKAPRPGLLIKVDNGVGATTSVRYSSIQDLDKQATGAGAPWTFHSPAVAMVVTRTATQDTAFATTGAHLAAPYAIDRSVEYEYRDPAYDRWKREFAGFRTVAVHVGGEDAWTETTNWFGPCERDGVVSRPLNGSPPTTNRCPMGSDDEFDDTATYRSRTGKPVRVDRFLPDRITQSGKRYLWSKRIVYAATNWLYGYEKDHTVTATFVREIETHHYDASAATSPGATETVAPDADIIQRPPVQAGEKITRRTFATLPETGEVHVVNDYGHEAGGDMPVQTSRYAVMNANWQYLPGSVPVYFDLDRNGSFETTARNNWHQYDSTTGDVLVIEADPGPNYELDRFHETGGATAPTPPHSAWWARLAEFHYDAGTGVIDEVRGAAWTASPQSCTKLVLDSTYHEFPRQVKQFKNGCNSADPLITDLAFDRGFGIAVAKTAPDGGMSSVELDAFGRIIGVALPDPSSTAFTETVKTIDYVDQSPLSYADVRDYTATFPTPVSVRRVAIANGVGEPVFDFSQDAGGVWVVSNWTERNGRGGRVSRSRRPFSTTDDPIAVASNALNVGASIAAGYFDTTYDGFGRAKEVRENGELIVERSFGPLKVTEKDKEQLAGGTHVGASRSVVLNGRGQVKQAIDTTTAVFGNTATEISYDGLGQPLAITKSYGSGTPYTRTMVWDRLGRLVENIEPNTSGGGHDWRYAYDDAGHLVGTSDARGCGKNISYDGLGRVIGEDYSPCLASHVNYTDGTSPGGLEVEYKYDTYEAGQIAPEPGFNDAANFANGRLVSVRDRGSHTRRNYDGRGHTRRTSRRIVKPTGFTPTLGDAYSDHWLAQRADFDTANRVTSRTSGVDVAEMLVAGQSVETYGYSVRGFLQNVDTSYGALVANMTYAADGHPASILYGDQSGSFAGTSATFTYDTRRRLQTYTVERTAHSLWSSSSAPPTYPLPDVRTTQTDLAHFVFEYDGVGNPTKIEDNADADQYLFDYAYPMKVRDMQYDDLYRVTEVAYGYGASAGDASFRSPYRAETLAGDTRPVPLQSLSTRVRQQTFSYDFLGNTISTSDNLGANYDRSLGTIGHGEVGGPNQLRSANGITAKYDAAGNMVELKVQRQGSCPTGTSSQCAQWFAYDWDEVGQLVRARRWDFPTSVPVLGQGELPASAPEWDLRFAYSSGVRVLKSAKDSTGVEQHTLDVFDTLRFDHVAFIEQVEDYDRAPRSVHLSLGGGVGHIVLDPDLPYVSSPIHRFINIGDHLGSAAITIDGESAELVERTTYQAFGALESDNRSPRWSDHREDWKFTGKEEDIEVGLTYFGFRYYAPYLGRWASADPLTIHGLGADLNPYAYVSGRVMRDVDPLGLEVPPPNAQDLQHHGSGDYSYVQPDGTISFENYGIDFNNSNSFADAHFREAFANRLNDAVMGHELGVDIPLPGGGYVNQGDIGRETVNHVAQSATPGWVQAAINPGPVFKTSRDPRNKSGTFGGVIGTIIDVGGTAGLGALAGVGAGAGVAVDEAGGAGARQTYRILDGVRRAKAAQLAGHTEIDAEIVDAAGRTVSRVRLPIASLLSPKAVIDTVSKPGFLMRWLNTLRQTAAGSPPPAIQVTPGTTGTPISLVGIGKP